MERLVAVAALLLAGPAVAQTVWIVPPPLLQPAIDAASPGDILVLNGATYEPFTLRKGLTIRGNGSHIDRMFLTNRTTYVSVPAGQIAHFERVSWTTGYSPYGNVGTDVSVQPGGGLVRFEQCQFAFSGSGSAVSINGADVTVVRSSIRGFATRTATSEGLSVSNSRLTLRDCTVEGANYVYYPNPGPGFYPALPAIRLWPNSTLHVERTTLKGGDYVGGSPIPGNASEALRVQASSAWLSDCTLTGGSSNGGTGGTALVNTGTTPVALRQTQLIGGTGSPSGGASSGLVDWNAPLVRLALLSPWTRGATSTLVLAGDANTPFALWVATDASATTHSLCVEPLYLVTGVPILGGMLDASGGASIPIAVPADASLEHATVWLQAVSGMQLPLRATTIAGGVVR